MNDVLTPGVVRDRVAAMKAAVAGNDSGTALRAAFAGLCDLVEAVADAVVTNMDDLDDRIENLENADHVGEDDIERAVEGVRADVDALSERVDSVESGLEAIE